MSDWLGLQGKRVAIAGGGGTLGGALVDGFLDCGSWVGVLDKTHASFITGQVIYIDGGRTIL